MKVSLLSLWNSMQTIELIKTLEFNSDPEFGYKIINILGFYDSEIKKIDDYRKKLVEKYAEKGEIKEGTENYNKFISDFTNFLSTEIDFEIDKINKDELIKKENKINYNIINNLSWMFEN